MLPNIHIFGMQGSGKDTQAEALAHEFGFVHISSGLLLREYAAKPEGATVAASLAQGLLIPDEQLVEIIDSALTDRDPLPGIIGAGVLRTMEQLSAFEALWPRHNLSPVFAVELQVPDDIAKQRMLARNRSDDTEEAIPTRLRLYHQETTPVVEALRSAGQLMSVDGTLPKEQVTQLLIDLVHTHVLSHGTH